LTVIISGAGIAGLALALSCHQANIPFLIFEKAPELQPLGVGINLQPHAVRELFELGLENRLDEIGVRTKELVYFSKTGKKIWDEPRGVYAGYKWPQYSLHRGELQMLLYRRLIELGYKVQLNSSVTRVLSMSDSEVTVEVVSPEGTETVSGQVLVAADGIHSVLRKRLAPHEGDPVWNGAVLWRGTSLARPFLGGDTIAYAGHASQKFVTYPIAPANADGLVLINWIAELNVGVEDRRRGTAYNQEADFADFFPKFEQWNFDWLDIPDLMLQRQQCYEYPMVDRDPLERWTDGLMTLLGDAAHPMYPIGSNGASQAILDARVLVREFLKHGVTRDALLAYEAERRPATNRLVLANRGNGPDQVMQIVEERCAGVFNDISEVLTRQELEEIAEQYKQFAGMQVQELNDRPSIITEELLETSDLEQRETA